MEPGSYIFTKFCHGISCLELAGQEIMCQEELYRSNWETAGNGKELMAYGFCAWTALG